MLMSRYVYRYLCEQNPKFEEKIKINNQNMIYLKYIKIINEDEDLKKLWDYTIENIQEINELAQKKYVKKRNENYELNKKLYWREYYKNYYNTHENYREYKKTYSNVKHKNNKLQKENELLLKEKEELLKIKDENDKLKNALNILKEVIN